MIKFIWKHWLTNHKNWPHSQPTQFVLCMGSNQCNFRTILPLENREFAYPLPLNIYWIAKFRPSILVRHAFSPHYVVPSPFCALLPPQNIHPQQGMNTQWPKETMDILRRTFLVIFELFLIILRNDDELNLSQI